LGCVPTNDKNVKEKIEVVKEAWKPFLDNVKKIIDKRIMIKCH